MMTDQSYSVQHYTIGNMLNYIQTGAIAIPEIQRPFVWEKDKVTKLIDSLFRGFPVGYIVIWQNPSVRLKDGSTSFGKKVIIDGQQRITALRAAILGEMVVNKDYAKYPIKVSYNPQTQEFATLNASIKNDSAWIKDISLVLDDGVKTSVLRKQYCNDNPEMDEDDFHESIDMLRAIKNRQIGVIELSGNLDIEEVTEIFIRINSEGVPLNQADFVMSTIAANDSYGGNDLRKCIDYFSNLAIKPDFYTKLIENDNEFTKTEYFQPISWLRNENDDIYDPGYVDLLRVAFTHKFNRGKMSDLVSLLSGRNFETRENEEWIKEETYSKLKDGVKAFINEYNFKHFVMIIRSAGFCDSKLIRSQNTLNFAYILYLKLRQKGYKSDQIEKYVRRWFVYSILRGRYSSSPESSFDYDVKQIEKRTDFGDYLSEIEAADLSDAFWDFGLVQSLNTSVASSPVFNVFLASQCKQNRLGFLSTDITVKDMIDIKGDVHHIFPREYLKSHGMQRGEYNQVANYVYTQTEINIAIGKKAPNDYLKYVFEQQCNGRETKYGGIKDLVKLESNLLDDCCIPLETKDMDSSNFQEFLEMRRKLIAKRLKEYYFSL